MQTPRRIDSRGSVRPQELPVMQTPRGSVQQVGSIVYIIRQQSTGTQSAPTPNPNAVILRNNGQIGAAPPALSPRHTHIAAYPAGMQLARMTTPNAAGTRVSGLNNNGNGQIVTAAPTKRATNTFESSAKVGVPSKSTTVEEPPNHDSRSQQVVGKEQIKKAIDRAVEFLYSTPPPEGML